MPLSTRRVSTVMPSMLMNSVAKVPSAESFASSFMASSRASMLCDWILSISWRAALDWEQEEPSWSLTGHLQLNTNSCTSLKLGRGNIPGPERYWL